MTDLPSKRSPHQTQHASLFALLRLAGWQLRSSWTSLTVTGSGLLLAVMLGCAAPLFSQVSQTAELRAYLNSPAPGSSLRNSDIAINALAQQASLSALQQIQSQLDAVVQGDLSGFLTNKNEFSFQLQSLPLLPTNNGVTGASVKSGDTINLIGATLTQATSHLRLLQGQLPRANGSVLDIALTSQVAQNLHAIPGSLFTIELSFVDSNYQPVAMYNVTLRVSGIFSLTTNNDPFWHGESFQPTSSGARSNAPASVAYSALVSNEGCLTLLQHILMMPSLAHANLGNSPQELWYYHLDSAQIDVDNLQTVQTHVTALNLDVRKVTDPPYVTQMTLSTSDLRLPASFSSRAILLQVPLTGLLVLVTGLCLLFVSFMTSLMVDRQAEAVAVMCSRGASRWQVWSFFALQCTLLCLLALAAGPLLAIGIVRVVASWQVSASGSPLPANLFALLPDLLLPTVTILGLALAAMVLTVNSALRRDVLTLRREQARSQSRPLWQRLHLDLLAGTVALTSYALILFVTTTGVLNLHAQAFILPPLILVGTLALLAGSLLLLQRLFSVLVRLGAWLAGRGRSAPALLALAHMARAPRYSLRMLLLLAFALASLVFTLVFQATQNQRITDVAAYQVGADFQGNLIADQAGSLSEAQYHTLPGVQAVSTGYAASLTTASDQALPMELRAVDADTFAQVAIWNAEDSTQALTSLMHQLQMLRAKTLQQTPTISVPAIIDAAAAQSLGLTIGATFTLFDAGVPVNFVIVNEVAHIPTVYSSSEASGSSDTVAAGGLLVDYQSYAAAREQAQLAISANIVWLRTSDDSALLAGIRRALSTGGLQVRNLLDRRAIVADQASDPLSIALLNLLVWGVISAVLIALISSLAMLWFSVRDRLTSLMVLRAIGGKPTQIRRVLLWEQGIVFIAALVLGVVFGGLLAALSVPTLTFTNIAAGQSITTFTAAQITVAQSLPPVHLIVPFAYIAGSATLALVLLLALRLAARPLVKGSMGQALRLNND